MLWYCINTEINIKTNKNYNPGGNMPLDEEIRGFIEKYKVTIWGTGDESLDLETEHSRRGWVSC